MPESRGAGSAFLSFEAATFFSGRLALTEGISGVSEVFLPGVTGREPGGGVNAGGIEFLILEEGGAAFAGDAACTGCGTLSLTSALGGA